MTQQTGRRHTQGNRADYGIVTALTDELTAVVQQLEDYEDITGGDADRRYYYRGTLHCADGSTQSVVCVCTNGMGQQAALNATRDLLMAWHPRHILLVGIAGGIASRGVSYGDLIVPRFVHYYEPGKLTPQGNHYRTRSFEPSLALQPAADALAVEEATQAGAAAWVQAIRVSRPDGSGDPPRVHREELATGEQVWADLHAPVVREVLAQHDKVVGIENEAAGVFNAVREAVEHADVLVVKGASDLVERKDDTWRAYAAAAAAAFTRALIERVGARWDTVATGGLERNTRSAPAVLAFLIADVRGYTHYTLEHGDDAAAELATQFATVAREIVSAQGGEVIELRGDEALAIFTSARRAIHAAIELQERCAREKIVRTGLPLKVGIGLDAGEAVPVEGGYRGGALNLAARLCNLAGPGEVLASQTITALARRIDGIGYRERGLGKLKGFDDPVMVMEVVAEHGSAVETVEGGAVPSREAEPRRLSQDLPIGGFLGALPTNTLVRRDEELHRILGAVDAVARGAGRLLMLAGEPGAGKTRLAQEATFHVRNRGYLVAAGSCFEQRQSVPYYPFLDVVASLHDLAPSGLRSQVAKHWRDLGQLLPEAEIGVPAPSGSHDAQERLFRAITGFVRAFSQQMPVAIMLDDLHWADRSSLDLLQHLAWHTRGDKVLLLGTYRDVEVGRQHPLERALSDLARHELVERIPVRRLDRSGTVALMSAVFGEGVVSEGLASLMYRRTEGNPFFTREVLQALVERGDVTQRDGVWDSQGAAELQVPESIRAVIGQRLSRLTAQTQAILREASVLGQSFRFDDLQTMGQFEERELERALEEAALAGLLREERGDRYAFNHALTQQALYQEISARKLRRLHQAAGGALERRGEERAGEIAWHYLGAADPERALPHALLAGDQAESVFAHAEAERQYRLAVELATEVGDTLREVEALEKLGGVLEWRAMHDEARDAYDAALRRLSEQNRLERAHLHRKISLTWAKWRAQDQPEKALYSLEMAELALGDEPVIAREAWRHEWMEIQLARAGVYYMVGRAPEMVEALERTLPTVEEWGTTQQQASLFETLAVATLQRDRYAVTEQTLGNARRAHALWQEVGDLAKIAETRFSLGFVHLWNGDLDEAERFLQTSLDEAAQTQDARVETRCLIYLAVLHRKRGRVLEAEEYAIRSQEMARIADLPGYLAMADANLSWVALRKGDLARARDYAQRGLESWSQIAAVSAACRWMVAGPLLGIALGANEDAAAVDHARAFLAPDMQPLPQEFAAALEVAVEAWDAGCRKQALALLQEAAALGRQGGYL